MKGEEQVLGKLLNSTKMLANLSQNYDVYVRRSPKKKNRRRKKRTVTKDLQETP